MLGEERPERAGEGGETAAHGQKPAIRGSTFAHPKNASSFLTIRAPCSSKVKGFPPTVAFAQPKTPGPSMTLPNKNNIAAILVNGGALKKAL